MWGGRRWAAVALVAAAALCAAAMVVLLAKRRPNELYGKYDMPYNDGSSNDMLDNSMDRVHSYSQGDRDTRERPYMLAKMDRLQRIIDSIKNGPAGKTVPIPPPKPHPKPKPRKIVPPAPKAKPTLSYMQRIMKAIEGIQLRINKAAKRQYKLEDLASDAKKLTGKKGKDGPVGYPGRPGPQGAPGDQGPPGKDGKPGKPGKDNNKRGLPGPPGVQGPQGKDGFDGTPDFTVGPRGPRGPPGERGVTGVPGAPGIDGVDGADGKPGPVGPPGPPGIDGVPGKDGEDGLPGPVGSEGKRGKPGLPGFQGPQGPASEEPGPRGPPGAEGPPGVQGAPGMTGQTGLRGFYGPRGPKGYPGLNGMPGAEGKMGISSGDVRVFGGSTIEGDELCHFPFLYEGKTYTRCTSHGLNQPWCYADSERRRWGYCDIEVEAVQGDSRPGDKCHFPYEYEGEFYTQCTDWQKSAPPDHSSQEAHHDVTWCFTDAKKTRYGICQQEVGGGTSEVGDVCTTPCRTDYSTRPWCYTAADKSRWGVCLYKEQRMDGSFVWV